MQIELARNSIGYRGGEFFDCLRLNAGLGFFYKRDISLVYVDDKILGLVREKILNNIVYGYVVCLYRADKYNRTRNIGIEIKLTRFEINISGKNIIKDYVLYEVAAVVLLVVIEFDIRKGNGDYRNIL